MFYADFVLRVKKEALATIWLAAHWERKLSKTQINQTNINKVVDNLISPEAPFALRLSGQLLLGVVRIYSRKAKYLLDDCGEALVKIKTAFVPGDVNLPPTMSIASINSITLPETTNIDFNLDVSLDFSFPMDVIPSVERGMFQSPLVERGLFQRESGFAFSRIEDISMADISTPRKEEYTEFEPSFRERQSLEKSRLSVQESVEKPRRTEELTPFEIEPRVSVTRDNMDVDDWGFGPPKEFEEEGQQEDFFNLTTIEEEEREEGMLFPEKETEGDKIVKKRKVAFDERTEISSKMFKKQLEDRSDITKQSPDRLASTSQVQLSEVYSTAESLLKTPISNILGGEIRALIAQNLRPFIREEALAKVFEEEEETQVPQIATPKVGTPMTPGIAGPETPLPHEATRFDEEYEPFRERTPEKTEDEKGVISEQEKTKVVTEEPFVAEQEVPEQKEEEPVSISTGLSKHAEKTIEFFANAFQQNQKLPLYSIDFLANKSRKEVSETFFDILLMKSRGYVDIVQEEPFGKIEVSPKDELFKVIPV